MPFLIVMHSHSASGLCFWPGTPGNCDGVDTQVSLHVLWYWILVVIFGSFFLMNLGNHALDESDELVGLSR